MKDSIKVHDYTTTRSLAQSRSKNILLGTCKVGLDSVPIPEFGLNHDLFFDPFPSPFRVLVPSPKEVHYKKIHKHQHTHLTSSVSQSSRQYLNKLIWRTPILRRILTSFSPHPHTSQFMSNDLKRGGLCGVPTISQ